MIKVGLIDTKLFFLNNYKDFLQNFQDISIAFSYGSLNELTNALSQRLYFPEPDIVLLDCCEAGITIESEIKSVLDIFPGCKLIMISGDNNEKDILESLKAGASGFLLKNARLMDIYTSIKDVHCAGACLSPGVAKKLIDHLKFNVTELLASRLTKREMELVNLLKEGFSYKEMAKRMFVSVYTVNHHLKKIYQKLGVESKSELISRILQKTI